LTEAAEILVTQKKAVYFELFLVDE